MPPPGGFVQPGGYPGGGYPPPSGGYAPEPGFIQPPPAGYNTYDNGDPEAPKNFSFDDQGIRKAFLRKVYSILMVSCYFVIHLQTKNKLKIYQHITYNIL